MDANKTTISGEDPFNLLDSLIPPSKPTKLISEEEWEKMIRDFV